MQRNENFIVIDPQIEIDNATGKVEFINREDGTVAVTVESLTAHAVELVEATKIVGHDNVIRVSVPSRSGFRKRDVLVRVALPASAAVNVSTVAADVEGSEVDRVIVKSVSGLIRFDKILSSAQLKTVSGDVEIKESAKDTSVASTSGDVRLGHMSGRCNVKSVSGECSIQASGIGDISIRTVSGDVKILIDPDIEIDVEAQTLSGHLTSEIALDGSTSSAVGPSLSIHSKTVSGNLRISRTPLVSASR